MANERCGKTASNTSGSPLRFTADPPLGKLCKLLRLLGFDVLYSNRAVLPIDGSEQRLRLTRSHDAAIGSDSATLFISNDHPKEQLKEVIRLLSIDREQIVPFTRCIECNVVLTEAKKENIREKVPEYVWHTHNRFSICEGCGRIYWSGSHTDHMARVFEEVFDLA